MSTLVQRAAPGWQKAVGRGQLAANHEDGDHEPLLPHLDPVAATSWPGRARGAYGVDIVTP